MNRKTGFVPFLGAVGASLWFMSGWAALGAAPGSIGIAGIPGLPGGIPGIPSGVPPILLTSSPVNGAKNVAVDSTISFNFLSAMSPVQSITWGGNGLDSSKFTYSWSADGKTLIATYNGSLPANTTITWVLDPNVFKDQSGTALLAINNSGTFTTGSGSSSNNGCNGGTSTNSNRGTISVYKSLRYVQTSASAPALDTDNPVFFAASVIGPKTNPVSQATLQLPSGATKTLTGFAGSFFVLDQFSSQAELDASYPAGAYKITVQFASGTGTVILNLTGNGPPTPQIVNFAQAQNFDPTADFALQWLPFTGAAPNDTIVLSLSDSITDFVAPDLCVPRPLKNTDTSILVPKNTFGAGTEIDGSLIFNSGSSFDTNSIPGVIAFAGYTKQTTFKLLQGGGTPPTQPELMNLVRQPQTGLVTLQVKAQLGASLVVEASDDLTTWTTVATGSPAAGTGVLDVSDSAASTSSHRFYRAKSL
jgi:Bacterial Ig-like domain